MEKRTPEDILVINYTSPEMNYLAAAIARSGRLLKYVRPYANLERPFERFLSHIPGASNLYRVTMARRIMPKGLSSRHIRAASVLKDWARAGCYNILGRRGKLLSEHLHWGIQKDIEKLSSDYVSKANIVFGCYVVAKKSFLGVDGVRVLNYPIAHHRYIQQFVCEEKELRPEFSSNLLDWSKVPAWVEKQLDEECALADIILVGSSFAMDSFISQGVAREKIRVIPYGTDVTAFYNKDNPSNSSKMLRTIFVGQLVQRKGISYLLEASRRLSGKGFSFTLVGSIQGDCKPFLPYREYITHIPHQPRASLPQIYQNHDVFVFPTIIEGMGLVVLEAMACGLPVITTSNGPGDIVRDGIDGFIVPIRDVDAICERLEILRANAELRVQMGRNARERAKEFSWESYMGRIANLVSEIDRQIAV